MAEKPEKRSMWSHPMTNVIVGFVLTGVVGTALTQYFFDRRQDEQLRAQRAQDRQDALDIAIQLTGESQIRIELLGEALLRDEPQEEIYRLKEQQEDAAIEWRKEVPRLLMLARDLLGDAEYDRFRMNIETRMKEEKLDPLRRCLNEAYAQAGDIDAVKRTVEQCRFEERIGAVADCAEALLGGLHQMTAAVGAVNREMDEARRQELGEQVSQACT
jgi:hypothetical protein